MRNKKYLNIFMILVLLLGFTYLKSTTVLAASNWIQTSQDSTNGITEDYTRSGNKIPTQDIVQAWHYQGTPEGYWKITDMNVLKTYPTILDSNTDFLLTHYDTPDYLTAYVKLPDEVLANIAIYGENSIRAMLHAKYTETMVDTNDFWYRVNGSYLEIQFKGHLFSSGTSFWNGRPGFVPMPLVDTNYGENAFSVFDINSTTHLGGMYTQSNMTPFGADNITMASGGWGLFNNTSLYYSVYDDNYNETLVKGSDMRISLGAFASGGAQAAVYYFPFDVQFYIKNSSGVTVKYVDEATGSDISAPDVYNNETAGSHTYNAKTISGYTLQGASTQTINVVSGQNYTVTFKYTKDPTTGSVTVKYIDKATGGDISAPDVYSSETPGSHTYNAKTISGYTLIGANSQTIDVVAGQSYTVIFNYNKSKLPTCALDAQPTAVVGDDVYLSAFGKTEDTNTTSLQTTIQLDASPYIAGTNPIKGDLKTFDAGAGGNANANGSVFFTYPGTYTVRAYTIDSNGNMGEATPKKIVVTNPIPVVNIVHSGTLKENRKVIIDASSSYSGSQRATINWDTAKWVITPLNGASPNDVRIQKHTTGSIDGTVLYDPSKGINNTLDGLQIFDMQFKKAGEYQVQCTLSNNYNISNSSTNSFTIIVDQSPNAYISVPSKTYRDPNNNNIATLTSYDESTDLDSDTIAQRVWCYAFDSNNDGNFDNETWYINVNGSWQPYGDYAAIKALANNVGSVNSGNLTSVNVSTTHVGNYTFELIAREDFGQEYVPQFITINDKKVGNTFDH